MPPPPVLRLGSLPAGRANPSAGHATCCDDAEREACSLINQLVRLYSTIPRFATPSCQMRFGRNNPDPANSPHALIGLPFQVSPEESHDPTASLRHRLVRYIYPAHLFPSTQTRSPGRS